MTPRREKIFIDINTERQHQLAKWGIQSHTKAEWVLILMEEVGEVCQAVLEGDDWTPELIQVAAVAVAILEEYEE